MTTPVAFNFSQTRPALTWNVQHNLNSDKIMIDVMVAKGGGIYEKVIPSSIEMNMKPVTPGLGHYKYVDGVPVYNYTPPIGVTATPDFITDQFIVPHASLSNGAVVQLYTTGVLPTGLTSLTNYVVVLLSSSPIPGTDAVQLKLQSTMALASFTNNGTEQCIIYNPLVSTPDLSLAYDADPNSVTVRFPTPQMGRARVVAYLP